MSFDLVKAGEDREFWDRLIRKYGKKIRECGWHTQCTETSHNVR